MNPILKKDFLDKFGLSHTLTDGDFAIGTETSLCPTGTTAGMKFSNNGYPNLETHQTYIKCFKRK